MSERQRQNIAERFSERWYSPRVLRAAVMALNAGIERAEAEAIVQHTAESARQPLLSWARAYLPDHFRLMPSVMHRWLEEQFGVMDQRRGYKLNVIGPRGSAKSTIGTLAWPLRLAVEGREPYIWIISDTKHQACAHLDNIKAEILDNELLAKKYFWAVGRGPVWQANTIVLRNGVVIQAFGTGQRLRGRRYREHRPSLIICDDLQNDQHIESARQRELSSRWFHGTLLKAGTKCTNLVNLATALHREALGLQLHQTAGWKSHCFRAIISWPTDMLLWQQWEAIYTNLESPDATEAAREFFAAHRAAMEAGAELLWPEEEDLYTLMCMRVESGRSTFEREKQSSPVNPALCEWPDAYFSADIWFEEWPRNLRVRTLALDPSKGADARRGDYSAYVALGVDRQGVLYVEADLARRPTSQLVSDGVEWQQRFHPDAFGVETNQFQNLLAPIFAEEYRRQGLLGAEPWPIENQVAKLVRIRRLGPYLSTGRLRFKLHSPSTKLLVEQLREFPQGNHDDGPDALEMAIRLAAMLLNTQDPGDGLGSRLPVG